MASLSTISSRLAQGVFEPVLRQRPRSPSLSRISQPSTPVSSSRTHRRCVSASTSASALLSSPALMTSPHLGFESFAHDRERALRRRTPHMFDDSSDAVTALETFGATNRVDKIIPLPAPLTASVIPRAVMPIAQETSHNTFGSLLFDVDPTFGRGSRSAPVSPRLRPRRGSLPSLPETQTSSPVQTAGFPPSPRLPVMLFSPKTCVNSNALSNMQLHNSLANLVRIYAPGLAPDDPKSARAVPQHLRPPMSVFSTSTAHTLYLPLMGYAPDEVTITVVPGEEGARDALRVVVDRWGADAEGEQSYLEYLVRFDESARLGGVQAGFRDGRLRLTVPRNV